MNDNSIMRHILYSLLYKVKCWITLLIPKRSLIHKSLLKRLKLLYFPPLSHHTIDHIYDLISENVETLMNSININKGIINTSPLFN